MTGLKALENLCNQCEHYQFEKGLRPKKCPFNKSCVFKERIEKELKALKIVKEKRVDVDWLLDSENVSKYNSIVANPNCELTQEEFDLVKNVFEIVKEYYMHQIVIPELSDEKREELLKCLKEPYGIITDSAYATAIYEAICEFDSCQCHVVVYRTQMFFMGERVFVIKSTHRKDGYDNVRFGNRQQTQNIIDTYNLDYLGSKKPPINW